MPHLFDPLTLRGLTLPNRIIVSPMCEYSSNDGFANDWHLVHLGSRAVGGAALTMTEATAVTAEGRISPADLGIWSHRHVDGLARIVRFVRSQGSAAGIQLAHAGRKGSTSLPWDGPLHAVAPPEGGWHVPGPTAEPFAAGYPTPVPLADDGITAIVEAFAAAAGRALDAGFDVVEVHAAHGYLIHEFLSPLSNTRTDQYGGSFAHRVRLCVDIVDAVRKVWPEARPLFVRLSATDWAEGGWDIDQSVMLARLLRDHGADLIDCSSGGNVSTAGIPVAPGYQAPFAERIRREADVATGAVGLITTPQQANEIITNGRADCVLLARERCATHLASPGGARARTCDVVVEAVPACRTAGRADEAGPKLLTRLLRLTPLMLTRAAAVCLAVATVVAPAPAAGQSALSGEPIAITRAAGPIIIDGKLSDAGWRDATRVERWYEINPGDNIAPPVRSVGYLTYDDKYFYAGFEFDDPNPKAILAPYGDHDYIQGNADFGGLFLDTRNEGHTAYEFQVTAHNIQFDAVMDDNGGGENASPDFFWESATQINDHGWTLEIRIPFSSLRYKNVDPQTWGIMLWRNYSRDFRHQIMSVKQPRGSQCFVCRESKMTGLGHLPAGGHLVVAPFLTAGVIAQPSGALGTPLVDDVVDHKEGFDLKWTPNADNVIDGTVRPDFSQIESDTAQIATNQRFALFFPEKRPFFLEGVELLSTPIQAVYTRTITAPDWGARATGKLGGANYTALVAQDAGGGSVIVPGPNSSALADQDFRSTVLVGRVKQNRGLSFLSFLVTDREAGDDGHNRVLGPDVQWRWKGSETIVAQVLMSDTKTPDRPEVNSQWTGATLRSGAVNVMGRLSAS